MKKITNAAILFIFASLLASVPKLLIKGTKNVSVKNVNEIENATSLLGRVESDKPNQDISMQFETIDYLKDAIDASVEISNHYDDD